MFQSIYIAPLHFSFSGLTIAEAKEQLYNKCFEWQRRIEKVMLESQIERLRVQCSEDSFVNTVAAHGQRKVNALEALNSKLKLSANSSFNAEVTSLSKAKALSIYQGVATAVGEKLLKADENQKSQRKEADKALTQLKAAAPKVLELGVGAVVESTLRKYGLVKGKGRGRQKKFQVDYLGAYDAVDCTDDAGLSKFVVEQKKQQGRLTVSGSQAGSSQVRQRQRQKRQRQGWPGACGCQRQ